MVRVNNIFTSEIDGVSPYKKYGEIGKLDRSVGSLEKRMSSVKGLLEKDNFFNDYFEKFYNPELNMDSALSEENNVCQMLTSMADYLIMSDESRQMEADNKTQYVFTEDSYNRKNIRHYNQFESDIFNEINLNDKNNKNVEFVQKPQTNNTYKSNSIVISNKDTHRNDEMSRIIKEYQSLLERLNELSAKDISNNKRYSSMKSLVNDDMIMVKESYLGVLPRSRKVPSSHVKKDVPETNLQELKTVKKLLSNKKIDLEKNYELWENTFDFDCVLQNVDLTEEEKIIADFRRIGWTARELIEDFYIYDEASDKNIKRLLMTDARHIYKKVSEFDKNRGKNG